MKFSENPKVASTAQCRTARRLAMRSVRVRIDKHCAEFCCLHFCFCRHLLAFKGNVKQKQTHRCTTQTKTNIFCLMGLSKIFNSALTNIAQS